MDSFCTTSTGVRTSASVTRASRLNRYNTGDATLLHLSSRNTDSSRQDRKLAQELFYQLEEQEISFYEAAHLYDIDENGDICVVVQAKLTAGT
jgi:hypothetical protein